MWHLLAFEKADTAGATLEQIPAVQDQIVTKTPNNNYLLQDDMLVRAAYFRDAGATGAAINTPKYRLVSIPRIHPVQRQAGVTDLPALWRPKNTKLILPKINEFIFEGSNNGAGGVAAVGGLWVSPPGDTMGISQGEAYTLRGTGTSAGVANAWETVALTLDEVLPDKVYDVVGLEVVQSGATGQAEFARLVWTGSGDLGGNSQWRPGVLVNHGFAEQMWPIWRDGNFGKLGSFRITALPNLEVFSVTGTALTYTVFIDVIPR